MNVINEIICNESKILLRVIGGIVGFKSMYDFKTEIKKEQHIMVTKYPTLLPLYTTIGGSILGLSFPKIMIGLVCIDNMK